MNLMQTVRISSVIAIMMLLSVVKSAATNVDPCDSITITLPTVNVTICDGDCFITEPFTGFISYDWSTGSTGSSIIICSEGTYSVTVTDSNGCTGVGVIEVEEYPNNPTTITAEFCSGEFVVVHGTIYDIPGVYTEIILGVTVHGCDSLIIITVLEKPLIILNITHSVCAGDSVYFDGVWYLESGTYTRLAQGSGIDCDTIVTIDIVVEPFNTRTVSLSMCAGDSVLYNGIWYPDFGLFIDTIASQTDGCDTSVIIVITEGPYMYPEWNVSICNKDSIWCYYDWCYESGIYYDTIAGIGGDCDTIATIILDVNMPTPSDFKIESDAGTGNGRIELTDTLGYAYQWSTGASESVISNLAAGRYIVTITSDEGCENIITYNVPGPFVHIEKDKELVVYPNPFHDEFSIAMVVGDFDIEQRLIVVNYLGQIVHSSTEKRGQTVKIGSTFQPGLYLVRVISQEEILASTQVVKTD